MYKYNINSHHAHVLPYHSKKEKKIDTANKNLISIWSFITLATRTSPN